MVNYKLNKIVKEVTENIAKRSSLQRKSYLERIKNAQNTKTPNRKEKIKS